LPIVFSAFFPLWSPKAALFHELPCLESFTVFRCDPA
jgi:hypothetical protein